MARSLEDALAAQDARIALSDIDEILDLFARGDAGPFDASYGDTLAELLPRRLSDLTTRH